MAKQNYFALPSGVINKTYAEAARYADTLEINDKGKERFYKALRAAQDAEDSFPKCAQMDSKCFIYKFEDGAYTFYNSLILEL